MLDTDVLLVRLIGFRGNDFPVTRLGCLCFPALPVAYGVAGVARTPRMAMDATLLVEGESVSSEDESIVRSRIDIPLRDRNAQSEGNEESGLE